MSLINQMLKDLEQRGAGSTDAKKIVPAKLITSAPTNNSLPVLTIVALLLLLIVVVGGYLWIQKIEISPSNNENTTNLVESNSEPIAKSASPTTEIQSEPSTNIIETAKIEPDSVQENIDTQTTKQRPLFESSLNLTTSSDAPATQLIDPKKIDLKPQSNEKKAEPPKQDITPNQHNTNASNNSIATKYPAIANTTTKSSGLSIPIVKNVRPDQKSDNYYRQALSMLQQGRVSEAQFNLIQALETDPKNHDARQTLVSLQLDNNRYDDAKITLTDGIRIAPEQINFRMALARLQVEANDNAGALITLEQGLPYANNNADFQSFIATMLQRSERHEEAINHYISSLSINTPTSNPNSMTNTLIGLGISLQAIGKLTDAKQAYNRAQKTSTLSPELSIFVEQQLKQINQHLNK